jgi:uncharacterized protein
MDYRLLIENLTNPALLFFVLGILAVRLKSDLSIPSNSAKFISLYLLFSIGFKGGQELAHSTLSMEIFWSVVFGLLAASIIPLYTFFILKRRLSIVDSGAIAAAYGSVSAVTFVTAITFLESHEVESGGHMVAVMALMEVPAIVIGVMLIRIYSKGSGNGSNLGKILHHSLTNGSVLLIIGSLIIGYLASDEQAMGIKPFTTDLFKGFMAIFLLDMGIESGRKLSDFIKTGWFTLVFALIVPLINGCAVAWLSHAFIVEPGDRFLIAVLASSASYIAVPAAMRIAAPDANKGIFVPMALAVTFPMNITIGLPIYYSISI